MVRLTGSWELTTDHAASSYGQPVLVRIETREAYGPGDIVQMFPSYGLLPARMAVARLARALGNVLDDPEGLVEAFLRLPRVR
jgi:hypothetical protein